MLCNHDNHPSNSDFDHPSNSDIDGLVIPHPMRENHPPLPLIQRPHPLLIGESEGVLGEREVEGGGGVGGECDALEGAQGLEGDGVGGGGADRVTCLVVG